MGASLLCGIAGYRQTSIRDCAGGQVGSIEPDQLNYPPIIAFGALPATRP